MRKFTGGCLCGELQYEINCPNGASARVQKEYLNWITIASQAIKKEYAFNSMGNPGATHTVKKDWFSWTKGEETLGSVRPSPFETKRYCNKCGESIGNFYDTRPEINLTLDTLKKEP